jgi:hypothetical protein
MLMPGIVIALARSVQTVLVVALHESLTRSPKILVMPRSGAQIELSNPNPNRK